MNKKIIFLSTLTAAILVGCGGGGGGSSAPSTRTISGNVIDPAVEGADVKLICNNKLIGRASTLTNDEGKFTINGIPASTELDKCTIEAKGGQDGGDDLSGLTLKAPYNLYENKNEFLITPLTTALTNHDEYFTNKETAKEDIRKFFGITKEDLMKNPMGDGNIKIARLTKKITKLALKRDDAGNRIGYVDLDNITSNKDNFINFINSNELKIDNEEKQKLKDEIAMIDKVKKPTSLVKEGIKLDTLRYLKKVFQKSSYSDLELANFNIITEKLLELRKVNNKYKAIKSTHIRKALSDLNITPSFENDGSIKSEIQAVLDKNENEFNTYLIQNPINISKVNSLTIYDSSSYRKVLGNNNDARIEYYMYSDKSGIGKAINLTKDSYGDSLLNPTYINVSKGFNKAGLYDESKEILLSNVYGEYSQISAYINMAGEYRFDNKFKNAEELLDKAFSKYKNYVKKKGASNLDIYDNGLYVNLFYNFFKINKKVKMNNVITYYEKNIIPHLTNTTVFGNTTQVYKNMILELIEEDNISDAQFLFDIAADYVKKTPITNSTIRSTISNMQFIAHLGPIIGKKDKSQELLTLMKKIDSDNSTNYTKLSAAGISEKVDYASFAGRMAGFTALMGDLDTVINQLNNGGIKSKRMFGNHERIFNKEETAMQSGVIAAYFMKKTNADNKAGIDLLYKHRPFKDFESRLGNQIYRYVPRKLGAYLDTSRTLKALDKNVMATFFDTLLNDMKTRPWTMDDKSYANYLLSSKYGLPIVIKHYHEVNNIAKRDETLSEAIRLTRTMKDVTYKASAYKAIVDIIDELKIDKTNEISTFVNEYATLSGIPTFDNTSKDYVNKYRSTLAIAKHLKNYGNVDTAEKFINAAIKSIPENIDNDITRIKLRVSLILGTFSVNSYNTFYESGINALITLKKFDEVEKLIDEVVKNIDTLTSKNDASELYRSSVHAYTVLNKYDKVVSTLNKIRTLKEKNDAKLRVIAILTSYDAFPQSSIAYVDTDKDGKADFFKKGTTAEQIAASKIELDDDIDGDGILDDVDELPYKKN